MCGRCGATLPAGLRPAQSQSKLNSIVTFAKLKPDQKNFCWVLHNMRALDASAVHKSFDELLTEAMDSLKIQDVLGRAKDLNATSSLGSMGLEQSSNDVDDSLQRCVDTTRCCVDGLMEQWVRL